MLQFIRTQMQEYIPDITEQRRLELCAEEILVNIIDYAYPETDGSLSISIEFKSLDKDNKQFCLTFIDNGIPYNPLTNQKEKPNIRSIEEQSVGGLGVFLYTTIMDGVNYQYLNGMNQLMIWKNL